MLFAWSFLGLYDPEDFRDLLLNNGKLVVPVKPDRERHPEVEQARKICQRILSVIPQSCEGLVFCSDTLNTTIRSECSILAHKSVKNGAIAMAESANDDKSLVQVFNLHICIF